MHARSTRSLTGVALAGLALALAGCATSQHGASGEAALGPSQVMVTAGSGTFGP